MKSKSFTLIELLVVIVIIGILAGVIMISTSSSIDKANTAKLKVFSESIQNNLAANMVSYYKLDSSAVDSWGSNNGANNGGGFVSSDCVSRDCIDLIELERDYIEITDKSILNLSTFTIEGWFYPRNQNINMMFYIGEDGNDGFGGGNELYIHSDASLHFTHYQSGYNFDISKWGVKINTWNHFSATVKNNKASLYLNGEPSVENSFNDIVSANWLNSIKFGAHNGGSTERNFEGLLDEYKIYNDAISFSKVRQNYIIGLNSLLSKGLILEEEHYERMFELSIK